MNYSGIERTDVSAIPERLGDELVVLDVREAHEWAAGHIEGAVHLPLGELPARVGELDPQTRTLIICHVGGRSAIATEWLSARGHDVANVEGGMDAWELAGRPVVR